MDGPLVNAASWLVIAAIAVVLWLTSRDGIAGWLGRLALAAIAIGATAGAILLARSNVSRESIAAAVLAVGTVLFGLFAVAMWSAFLASMRHWLKRRRTPPDAAKARAARRRADFALAVSLLGCAVGLVVSLYGAEQERPPHAAGLVDARLAPDARRAWSLGVDGELLEWRLVALPAERAGRSSPSPYRVERRHRLPAPPAHARLVVAHDGTRIATLADGTVRVYALPASGSDATPSATVEGITAVAATGGTFVLASSRGLEWLGPSDAAGTALAWPLPIVALAASPRGELVFAEESGRLVRVAQGEPVPLAAVPGAVRSLAFDSAGDRLLVFQDKSAIAIDMRTNTITALGGETADFAAPAGGTRMLVCNGAAVSCTWLDLADGRRGAGFSGVLKEYARVDGAPGAALLVGERALYVETLGADGQGYGGAFLRDPRF
jgi:hypothetical protein